MVDLECRDLQTAIVEDDDRVGVLRDAERLSGHARCSGWGYGLAVVGGAIAAVEREGLVVTGNDPLHSGRADHPHLARRPLGDPALNGEAAETADVVRVEVSEQHGFDPTGLDPHPVERLGCPLAGIDDEHPPAGDHGHTRIAPLGVGQWRSGAADRGMQPVRHLRHGISAHSPWKRPLGHGQGDPPAQAVGPGAARSDQHAPALDALPFGRGRPRPQGHDKQPTAPGVLGAVLWKDPGA